MLSSVLHTVCECGNQFRQCYDYIDFFHFEHFHHKHQKKHYYENPEDYICIFKYAKSYVFVLSWTSQNQNIKFRIKIRILSFTLGVQVIRGFC